MIFDPCAPRLKGAAKRPAWPRPRRWIQKTEIFGQLGPRLKRLRALLPACLPSLGPEGAREPVTTLATVTTLAILTLRVSARSRRVDMIVVSHGFLRRCCRGT